MRCAHLLLFLALTGGDALVAQRPLEKPEAKPKNMSERLAPMLDLLPPGSTIKKVRIPRFDKEKRRAALMQASVLKVISEEQISGQSIELRVFSKEGPESLRIQMGAADFFRPTGILKAKDEITLVGENSGKGLRATGREALFHLDSRQGFVRGPVSTTFIRPEVNDTADEAEDENENETTVDQANGETETPEGEEESDLPAPPPRPNLADFGAEFLEPQGLTPRERKEMDLLLLSRSKSVLADRAPTRAFMTRSQQMSQAAEVSFRSFTTRVKQKNLLAKVSSEENAPPPQIIKLEEGETRVTCEGGMYLDPEHGHISYLRNIEVYDARFHLTCSNALKAFFDPVQLDDPGEKDEELPGEDELPPRPTSPEDLQVASPGDFSQLQMFVASGGVRIVREDPTGQRPPIIASAETVIIDVVTGDMVLQGGSPNISQGMNSLRAGEPELYLRYYANGNIFAERGRWTTVGDLASLKQEQEQEQKKEKENLAPPESEKPGADEAENPAEDAQVVAAGQAEKKKAPHVITVTCNGGIYFDARDGHIVYLDQVKITDPRFRVSAKKELKIFLRRRPEADEKGLRGPEAFSDVDHIVASGEVTVTRNDPGGKREPVSAKAAHAIFAVESTGVFLQGGTPTITQGANSLQAGAPDLYLRFYENGSLFAEPGPWTTVGDLANLRGGKGEKKKPANIVKVTCKGGLFFDSLKGQIVYLDQIVVLESRFAMNSAGSLRIHLEERENAQRDRLEGPEAFSDVNVIVATGGVTVVRRDPKGKAPITASAETATYDAKSGNIVLRGGFPAIRRGKSHLKALEPGLYLLFEPDGRFRAKKGKWDTTIRDKDFEELRRP